MGRGDEWDLVALLTRRARRVASDTKIALDNADRLYWHHATAEASQRAEMRQE